MIHYETKNLSLKQTSKFLNGSVLPRPIAWISTLTQDQKTLNLAPFSYFNIVSSQQPLISISVIRPEGQLKDTARNLLATKEVVLQVVSGDLLAEMNQTSFNLAPNQSELTLTNLTTVQSNNVTVPGIKEAKIRLEGHLYQHIPIYNSDNTQVLSDLFIIEISDFHFHPDVFDLQSEYILAEALEPWARLAGDSYTNLGTITQLSRPTQ